MNKRIGLRWAVIMAGAMLLVLAAACGGEKEIVEVVKEVVVEKEVVKEVPVNVEKVVEVEKEVVKEVKVEVPVEVVKEVEVIKEVPKVITEEKVVVREVEKIVVATPAPAGEQPFLIRALDPNAKYGGTLIAAAHGPPAHFDLIGSPTIANHGIAGQMWENLLQLDPRTTVPSVIPSLAVRWEISPDFKTYSFDLRQGVMWSDGTEFTSADVKATYDRLRFPRADQVSIRGAVYDSIAEINAPGKYEVDFVMSRPVAAESILPGFAMAWTEIVQKKTLDENNGDLHDVDVHPGTGPFRHVSRDEEGWVLEANPDHWNPYVPYLDGIKHIWVIAWTPELSAMLFGGVVDWGRFVAQKDALSILRGEHPGLSARAENIPLGTLMPLNTERLTDARVRKAIQIVVDQKAMNDVVSDLRGAVPGAWFIPGTPYAKPQSVLDATPGLRPPTAEDIELARQLMADAGYPNGEGFPTLFMPTRETPSQRTQAPLIQAMLKDGLNIDVEISIEDASGIQLVVAEKTYDLLVQGEWNTPVPDPSIYLRSAYGVCGDAPCAFNLSLWNNPEYNALLEQFDAELDQEKRLEIADKMWDVLNREAPADPRGSSENMYFAWKNDLKGGLPHGSTSGPSYNDLNRWDIQWLDR